MSWSKEVAPNEPEWAGKLIDKIIDKELSERDERISELEAENGRLRNALQQIAETDTDWRTGQDGNMNVVRGIAESVLYKALKGEEE